MKDKGDQQGRPASARAGSDVLRVRAGRVYGAPETAAESRVLVDKFWPRGLSKEKAALDLWCKDVAPSDELRRWYGHDPVKFAEFARRYREELTTDAVRTRALDDVAELAAARPVVLLTATRTLEVSQAAVLADLLSRGDRLRRPS